MIGPAPKPLLPQPVVATEGVSVTGEEEAAAMAAHSRLPAGEVVTGLKNPITEGLSVRRSAMVPGKMESMSSALATFAPKKSFSVTPKTQPSSTLVSTLTSTTISPSRPPELVCLSPSTPSPILLWTLCFWRISPTHAIATPPPYKSIPSPL